MAGRDSNANETDILALGTKLGEARKFRELAILGSEPWNAWAEGELSRQSQTSHGKIQIGAASAGAIGHRWPCSWQGFEFPWQVEVVGNAFEAWEGGEPPMVRFTRATFHKGFVCEGSAGEGLQFSFRDVTFEGSVSFQGYKPTDMTFTSCRFQRPVTFAGAEFAGNAGWVACGFQEVLDLSGATFEGMVSFERCEFCRPPNLDGIAYKRAPTFFFAKWEPIEWRWAGPWKRMEWGSHSVHRYRRLKQLAAEAHDHRGELNLFALETKARRATMLSWREPEHWPELLTGGAYELCSDFGRSIGRPLLLLFALWVAFARWFAWVGNKGWRFWEWDYPVGVASLTSLLPFAGMTRIGRSVADDLCSDLTGPHLSDCLSLLYYGSALEGVLAAVLLFLLLLGVRNTFRIR